MSENDVPRLSEQEPLEPLEPKEYFDAGMGFCQMLPSEQAPKPRLTIAQAYREIEPLLNKDSFSIDIEIWRFVTSAGKQPPIVQYRLYCAECKTDHGNETSLETIVENVKRVHGLVAVGSFEEQVGALRDIGELDRQGEASGEGPQ